MAKIGPCATEQVKVKGTDRVIRINVGDFNSKVHVKIGTKPKAKAKAKPKE